MQGTQWRLFSTLSLATCEPWVMAIRPLLWIPRRQEACGEKAEERSLWNAKVCGRHLCASDENFLLFSEGTIISEVGK